MEFTIWNEMEQSAERCAIEKGAILRFLRELPIVFKQTFVLPEAAADDLDSDVCPWEPEHPQETQGRHLAACGMGPSVCRRYR